MPGRIDCLTLMSVRLRLVLTMAASPAPSATIDTKIPNTRDIWRERRETELPTWASTWRIWPSYGIRMGIMLIGGDFRE